MNQSVFIVNPAAGRGRALKELKELETYFQMQNKELHFHLPRGREETINLVSNLASDGVSHFVGLGGDGTMNAIANGLLKNRPSSGVASHLTIGLGGTGQDYYKSIISRYKGFNWKELIFNYDVRSVDIGEVKASLDNGESSVSYFLNMASILMIPKIVEAKEKSNHSPYLPPSLRYLLPTLKILWSYPSQSLTLEIDGVKAEVSALALTISKGRYAGGGMQFAEKVMLDDSYFEITLFTPMTPLKMVMNLGKLYSGKCQNVKGIVKYFGKDIKITSKEPIPFEFDGESSHVGVRELHLKVRPRALKLTIPTKIARRQKGVDLLFTPAKDNSL